MHAAIGCASVTRCVSAVKHLVSARQESPTFFACKPTAATRANFVPQYLSTAGHVKHPNTAVNGDVVSAPGAKSASRTHLAQQKSLNETAQANVSTSNITPACTWRTHQNSSRPQRLAQGAWVRWLAQEHIEAHGRRARLAGRIHTCGQCQQPGHTAPQQAGQLIAIDSR